MLYNAKVTVYVNGQELRPELMIEEELIGIQECVQELFQTYGTKLRFQVAFEEDMVVFCVNDDRIVPFPTEWETKVLGFANGKEYRLIGDKIPITCRILGRRVEVKLTNYEDE